MRINFVSIQFLIKPESKINDKKKELRPLTNHITYSRYKQNKWIKVAISLDQFIGIMRIVLKKNQAHDKYEY